MSALITYDMPLFFIHLSHFLFLLPDKLSFNLNKKSLIGLYKTFQKLSSSLFLIIPF